MSNRSYIVAFNRHPERSEATVTNAAFLTRRSMKTETAIVRFLDFARNDPQLNTT